MNQSSQPAALTPAQLTRIANNKEAAQRRRAAKEANLSPEMLGQSANQSASQLAGPTATTPHQCGRYWWNGVN